MNIIEINIGGHKYKISCKPGEENHLLHLSEDLNQRYAHFKAGLGDKASHELLLIITALNLEDESKKQQEQLSNQENDKEKISLIDNKIGAIIEKLEAI